MTTGLRYRGLLRELKSQLKERGREYDPERDLVPALLVWSDGVQASKGRSLRIVQSGLANHSTDVRGTVHSKVLSAHRSGMRPSCRPMCTGVVLECTAPCTPLSLSVIRFGEQKCLSVLPIVKELFEDPDLDHDAITVFLMQTTISIIMARLREYQNGEWAPLCSWEMSVCAGVLTTLTATPPPPCPSRPPPTPGWPSNAPTGIVARLPNLGTVRLYPRLLLYLCDIPEARVVFGRLLYVLPSCFFATTASDGTKTGTLHDSYFRPPDGSAVKSTVGTFRASTPCVTASPHLREHLAGDEDALLQATYLPCCTKVRGGGDPKRATLAFALLTTLRALACPPPTPCPGGPPPLLQIALDDPANRIVIGAPSGSVLFVPDPMHVVWRPTMYFQRSLR